MRFLSSRGAFKWIYVAVYHFAWHLSYRKESDVSHYPYTTDFLCSHIVRSDLFSHVLDDSGTFSIHYALELILLPLLRCYFCNVNIK